MLGDYFLTIVLVSLLAIFFYVSRKKSHTNLPPGPKGLPIIGTVPPSGMNPQDFFMGLQKEYGDIFSVRTGSELSIFLMRYDLIKEAFSIPQLQGRPDSFTLRSFSMFSNAGLVFSEGLHWQNGRRFALRHLKDLGMGRMRMEDFIIEETQALIDDFSKHLGKPMEVANNVNVAILNVIWKLVAGKRFDVTNKGMQTLTSKVEENLTIILGPMAMLDWFPVLLHLPQSLLNYFFNVNVLKDNMNQLLEFLSSVIDEHRKTLDPSNVRDYIDQYLVEMDAQKDDPNSTFSLLDLKVSILDLYSAGSETTSSTVRWFILYMAVHPDVQEKAQKEIDDVVPSHRLTELQDKLPYFDAVIAEVNRIIALTPIVVPHAAMEDVQFAGYTIPKRATVFACTKACHMDPKLWDKPEEFRPERFLDSNGNYVTREGYMPFSTGRRQCLGESVARMELFIIGSSLLKTFKISPPEGVTLTTDGDPNAMKGVLNFAKQYKVVLTKRQQE